MTELSDEDFFGKLGMIDGAPRRAAAVALEDGTRVAVIDALNLNEHFNGTRTNCMVLCAI